MGEAAGSADLARLVREELTLPAPDYALRLVEAIRARIGPALAAVVFYGSCLRQRTPEGVLDFYAVVDDWSSAAPTRFGALAGAAFPPSVYYVECTEAEPTLRAKYAVLTATDLARGAAPGGWRSGIWARFCQPARAAWARDAAALDAVVSACAASITTAVASIAPLLETPASPAEFWQTAFAETYAREMRAEQPETIRALHDAAPERYARALRGGLAALAERGGPPAEWADGRFHLALSPEARRRARQRWARRRPIAKVVVVGQLVKTAFTFGDWLPYALWKLERHSGVRLPYSERQRRHPFVFGWPLLIRALRTGALR